MVRKEKQLDIVEKGSDLLWTEASLLLANHRERFHNDGSPHCVICRSLKRTIVRGIKI